MNQKKKKIASIGADPVPAQDKGITLIALVVTIIVLLILAGVTINMVLGDDGIIGQAKQATQTQAEAERNEINSLAILDNKINQYRQPGAYGENGNLIATWSEIQENVIDLDDDTWSKGQYIRENSIKSVIIPAGVETIKDSAFYDCGGLTNITIPDSVNYIRESAFYGCTGLTNIVIPNSVTSIGDEAFSECTGLTNITIPDSVISISDCAFRGCTGLTNITIPGSVTSIANQVFYGCTGLTNITIPGSVTYISGEAFYGCTGLTNITIPISVTTIEEDAFSGCNNLVINYQGTETDWNNIEIYNYSAWGDDGITVNYAQ